jgi:hypothetical protein
MMKLLVCLIVVIGVRARPQGSVVSEVTTVANFEEVNELTTQFGEDDLIEIENKFLTTKKPVAKSTDSKGEV